MWLDGWVPIIVSAAAAFGAGWLVAARLSARKGSGRGDLSTGSLVTETERQMLELVANGASLSEVLNTLTQAIERISPESHCTIMLLDEEHRRRLLIASGPSLPQAYLQAVNGLEIGPEVGACGSAAYRNETVIVPDIGTDPRFAVARDFVLSHGLRSCWSQPIRDSRGSVLGTFAIYRRQISHPRPEELVLARVAGQLAGNAIERIRAEKQLSDALQRLRLAERVARFGIWEADFQKNIVTLSEGLAALMERPPSKFQLTRGEFEALVHPEDRAALWAGVDRRDPAATTQQSEFRLVLPSGTLRWMRCQWGFEQSAGPPAKATGAMIDVTVEKDCKTILELVANDEPLEQVASVLVQTLATHLPGALCGIRIQMPGDGRIAFYPGFPAALAEACDRIELSSITQSLGTSPIEKLSAAEDWKRSLEAAGDTGQKFYRAVSVAYESQRVGVIFSLLGPEHADCGPPQKLLETWGRFARLAVERRGLYKQLSFRAQYDSLTNLLNRASLYEYLARLLRTNVGSIALIYLDLDGFKQINDTCGHATGDLVLQHVARQLSTSVRRTDAVARFGGDEFVIALPGVSERSEAARIALNLDAAISTPVEIDGEKLTVSASLGVSLYPADGNDIDALLKNADQSMYKMKLTHRSRRSAMPALQAAAALAELNV